MVAELMAATTDGTLLLMAAAVAVMADDALLEMALVTKPEMVADETSYEIEAEVD